jgi:twitching motility protein PilT
MDHSSFAGDGPAPFESPEARRTFGESGSGGREFGDAESQSDATSARLSDAEPHGRTWDELAAAPAAEAWDRPATERSSPTTWDAPVGGEAAPDMAVDASGDRMPSLDELLSKLIELDASDLHLKVGSPPAYRLDGELHFAELRTLKPADTDDFADQVMPSHISERFAQEKEADFAYGKPDLGRFRVNVFRQRGSISVVLRAVPPVSSTFEELGLPQVLERVAKAERGLIIVTGRAGTGKSTTVGAIIDYINTNRRCNIITLEDPIEILHTDKMSIVSQREIGLDTESYKEGMHRALRQDADVIFMGEMRDLDAMEAALHAAESGKLVITTMLTADAVETVLRIIEAHPPFQQKQVRYMLASVLKGVMSHRLVPRADGQGRAVALESLTINERTYERITDPEKTHLLLDAIVDGSFYGMQSFDQALIKLYQKRIVSFEDAMSHATDPSDFKLAAQAMGLATS